jgi:hypothetical protein
MPECTAAALSSEDPRNDVPVNVIDGTHRLNPFDDTSCSTNRILAEVIDVSCATARSHAASFHFHHTAASALLPLDICLRHRRHR